MTTVQSSYLETEAVRPEVLVQTAVWPHWGAILMGAVSAIGLQLIFAVLGIALGLTIATSDRATGATNIGMVGTLWWLLTGWVSLMVGGFILGRALRGGEHGHAASKPRDYAGWRPLRTERHHVHSTCFNAMTLWSVVAIFGFMVLWSGLGMGAGAAAMMPASEVTPRSGNAGRTSPVLWQDPQDNINDRGAAGEPWNRRSEGSPLSMQPDRPATPQGFSNSPQQNGTRYISQPQMMYVANDEIRRTARAASWWSVVGLIIGIAAVWGGAAVGLSPMPAPSSAPGRR